MHLRILGLLSGTALFFAGCEKREATQPPATASPTPDAAARTSAKREWGEARFDVCALLTAQEISESQGLSIKETKSSGGVDGDCFVSQCIYLTPQVRAALVLSMTEKNASNSGDIRKSWENLFSERHHEEEGERERVPPRRIEGVGDEAYWASGALYVLILKREAYLRIGLGGSDENIKLNRAKALASLALQRL